MKVSFAQAEPLRRVYSFPDRDLRPVRPPQTGPLGEPSKGPFM